MCGILPQGVSILVHSSVIYDVWIQPHKLIIHNPTIHLCACVSVICETRAFCCRQHCSDDCEEAMTRIGMEGITSCLFDSVPTYVMCCLFDSVSSRVSILCLVCLPPLAVWCNSSAWHPLTGSSRLVVIGSCVECIQDGLWRHSTRRPFFFNFGQKKEAKGRLSFWYPTGFLFP